MSSPDNSEPACDVAQADLHALLIDGEGPSEAAERLWAHVNTCERCTRAVAGDRALRRALERLRGHDRAPDRLRERVRQLVNRPPGSDNGGAAGGGPRSE